MVSYQNHRAYLVGVTGVEPTERRMQFASSFRTAYLNGSYAAQEAVGLGSAEKEKKSVLLAEYRLWSE